MSFAHGWRSDIGSCEPMSAGRGTSEPESMRSAPTRTPIAITPTRPSRKADSVSASPHGWGQRPVRVPGGRDVLGLLLPRLSNWESNSRMDLVYALGDQPSIRIDDYYLNTQDRAYFRGHYYTEKSIKFRHSPAVPLYEAFRAIVRLPPLARVASGDATIGSLPPRRDGLRGAQVARTGSPGRGTSPRVSCDGPHV